MNDERDKQDGTRARRDASEENLAREILALPRELAPPQSLWVGLEARLEAQQRRTRFLRRSVAGGSILLAAAAAVLLVRSGTPRRGEDQRPAPLASESVHVAPAASADDEQEGALVPEEASYLTALAALGPTFAHGEQSLPEKDLAAVNASLSAIDAAILVTRGSLVDDPEDPDLRGELDAEYEQKIDTMNDVLEWTTRS